MIVLTEIAHPEATRLMDAYDHIAGKKDSCYVKVWAGRTFICTDNSKLLAADKADELDEEFDMAIDAMHLNEELYNLYEEGAIVPFNEEEDL